MTAEELETLIRMHQAEIYRYVRYLGAESVTVAEDLVQETFLAAYKREGRADAEGAAIREPAAWLRGIARNLFLMHCRRRKSSPVRVDSASLERAEATWTAEFLREGDGFDYIEALRACLRKLADKHRKLLDLHYSEGKSRAEIAASFQMSEDGVKSLMRRLRAVLGDCIRRQVAVQDVKFKVQN